LSSRPKERSRFYRTAERIHHCAIHIDGIIR
jgi:hypothetical protein